MIYPDLPLGQHMASGQDWHTGTPPVALPPDHQVGNQSEIPSDYN